MPKDIATQWRPTDASHLFGSGNTIGRGFKVTVSKRNIRCSHLALTSGILVHSGKNNVWASNPDFACPTKTRLIVRRQLYGINIVYSTSPIVCINMKRQ